MPDAWAAVEWMELERLMREHYPDLPPHKSYFELLHDAFIKFPKEVTELVKPALPHLAQQLPNIAAAVATLYGSPKSLFTSQIAGVLMDVKSNISHSDPHNLIEDSVDSQGSKRRGAQALTELEDPKITRLLEMGANDKGPVIKNINGTRVPSGPGWWGTDGHAQPVYDFVETKIEEDTEGDHRYFIYHPDTNWIPAFKRLIRTSPLPASFCAIFDDLDIACQRLQNIRRQLNTESDKGKDIVLHLLIPGWYHVSIVEPLHFPDDLQPFRIHGLKHKGQPYTTFNLPAAPLNFLDDVGNKTDPQGWNSRAEMGAAATWMIGGTALNFGSNALGITAAGALGLASGGLGAAAVVVPIWFGGFFSSASTIGIKATRAVHEILREESPRILDSQDRYNLEGTMFV